MIIVGRILKAHGIRGEVKVDSYMDSPESFLCLTEVAIEDTVYTVEKARLNGVFVLLKLLGVDTMNDAEAFRNKSIYSAREKLPAPPNGRYYIEDLIGASIHLEGEEIGRLQEILQHGSADVYVVSAKEKTLLFPFVDGVVEKIDSEGKAIYLNKERFLEVAVYED